MSCIYVICLVMGKLHDKHTQMKSQAKNDSRPSRVEDAVRQTALADVFKNLDAVRLMLKLHTCQWL